MFFLSPGRVEKTHCGHYDDSYAWTVPTSLEHDSTYQIEAFSSQGQYAITDYFTVVSAPTASPTSAPEDGSNGDDGASGLDTGTEVAISSVSALVGAVMVTCCFMCYRSYKTRGRPTAWLYDTHIAMAGQEDRAAVEMGTISSPMGGGVEADVVMGGPVHQVRKLATLQNHRCHQQPFIPNTNMQRLRQRKYQSPRPYRWAQWEARARTRVRCARSRRLL